MCTCVCRELGEDMPEDELRAMIDEFDKDGDGESESWLPDNSTVLLNTRVCVVNYEFIHFVTCVSVNWDEFVAIMTGDIY